MARIIPPYHTHKVNQGEQRVIDLLRECDEHWTAMHSVHLPKHVRQVEGEADFVILMPKLGILVLEVKGDNHISYRDGTWRMFGDSNQALFGERAHQIKTVMSQRCQVATDNATTDGFVTYTLGFNCRNTQTIAKLGDAIADDHEALQILRPTQMSCPSRLSHCNESLLAVLYCYRTLQLVLRDTGLRVEYSSS